MNRRVMALALLLASTPGFPAGAQAPAAHAWASSVLHILRANIRHAEPRPQGAEAELALQVDATGKVTRHFLHTRSHSASWDQAVLDAAARTRRLPPPPADAQKPFRLLLVVRAD
ncbi:TonB family protein [Ramlibacter pallidus]|uniref:TonB C-terminal domain-containing protein n=1 Tax=Ramlibacter pallidus TaxID=2780087 RepID=A0ABR9S0I7_9BURK|nr:TonB C-terminal domain-containing protein [Ramlibacter pallidus]